MISNGLISLNQSERSSLEFLKKFTDALLNGEAIDFNKKDIDHLRRLGIQIGFVNRNKVKKLIKGKDVGFVRHITNAPWYIRGNDTVEYLPFQIKELK